MSTPKDRHVMVRLPLAMYEEVRAAAAANERTVSSEVRFRLRRHVERHRRLADPSAQLIVDHRVVRAPEATGRPAPPSRPGASPVEPPLIVGQGTPPWTPLARVTVDGRVEMWPGVDPTLANIEHVVRALSDDAVALLRLQLGLGTTVLDPVAASWDVATYFDRMTRDPWRRHRWPTHRR